MVISVLKQPGAYCFLGNPVDFQFSSQEYGAIDVSVSCGGETFTQSYYPFQKDGLYYFKFDISNFLYRESGISSFKQGIDLISELPNFSTQFTVKIEKVIESDFSINDIPVLVDFVFNGIAFQGGVNDQQFGAFQANNLDIFSYRLNNPDKQYLFTTRTHSKTIRLKETEMYPFVFLHPGKEIVFRSEAGNVITSQAKSKGTVCLLDLYKVKDKFAFDFDDFTSKIEVLTAGNLSFTFIIEESKAIEERCKIRFRNSLGAFEIIEVTGSANHEPTFSEENTFKTITDFNYFEKRNNRAAITDVLKVETGYKNKEDIDFIRDMICSDEVYFYYPDNSFFRCIVKVDKISYRHRIISPTSIPLIVSEIGTGEYISPELNKNSLSAKSNRIFDLSFDNTFN